MTAISESAWIGLGSNRDGPVGQVRSALDALDQLPRTRLARASTLYRNPPMGPPDQPDYVNAVAELATALTAHQLLAHLQVIEADRGRERTGERWGSRPLDLDLLVYGAQRIADPDLTVPHPGVPERAFVLYPLVEVAPQLWVPGMGWASELARALPGADLEPIPEQEQAHSDS